MRFLFVLTLNQFWVVPKVSELNHCYVTLMSFWMIMIFYLKPALAFYFGWFSKWIMDIMCFSLICYECVIKTTLFLRKPFRNEENVRRSHTWWQIIQCIFIGPTLTDWQKTSFWALSIKLIRNAHAVILVFLRRSRAACFQIFRALIPSWRGGAQTTRLAEHLRSCQAWAVQSGSLWTFLNSL